jgi:hypothetical protein
MLSMLKVKRPSIYGLLRRGSLSANEFFRDSRIDQLTNKDGQGVNPEWVADTLNFCLMSETEFEQATKDEEGERNFSTGPGRMGQWLVSFNVDRRNVIPFFCERLDRFSLQP